jgi:CheY-like chemotaxis protein
VQTFAAKTLEKGLELKYYLPAQFNTVLVGDAHRLRQILINLIGNAVKFTETGGISIEVQEVSSDQTEIVLKFCVKDTGISLPAEVQDKIFEPFTQADSSITRKFGGTGLGLTISKKFIGLLGGELWVESEPGKGSNFYFTARYLKGDSVQAKGKALVGEEVILPSLTILLAEDNEINRELAKIVLEQKGHRVVEAVNGMDVLEKLAADTYDMILMDIQMPELDGIEATKLIRACQKNEGSHPHHQELLQKIQNNLSGRRLPIVAMTANAMADDRRKCIEAGMDSYIAKPFQPEELFGIIAMVTAKGLSLC